MWDQGLNWESLSVLKSQCYRQILLYQSVPVSQKLTRPQTKIAAGAPEQPRPLPPRLIDGPPSDIQELQEAHILTN